MGIRESEQIERQSADISGKNFHDLESVYEAAPVGFCTFDTELKYRRLNGCLAEMNGIPIEDHIGKTVHEILPFLSDEIEPFLLRVLETGDPILNIEIQGETDAFPGVVRYWREYLYPFKDIRGKIIGINATFQEITDLKYAEMNFQDAMEQAERKTRELEAVLNSMAEGVMIYDLENRLQKMNISARKHIERFYTQENLYVPMARKLKQWKVADSDGNEIAESEYPLNRVRRGEAFSRYTIRSEHTATGSSAWFSYNGAPVLSTDGSTTAHVITFEDISLEKRFETEHRAILNELKAAHEKTLATIESITDGFISLDRNWRITYVNENGARLVHMKSSEMIGLKSRNLFPFTSGSRFTRELYRSIKTRTPVHFEEYYPEPLNIWLECHGYPSAEGLSIIYRDITERKRAEEALRESEKKLQMALDAAGLGTWTYTIRNNMLEFYPRDDEASLDIDRNFRCSTENMKKLWHPDDLDRTIEAVEKAIDPFGAGHFDLELRIRYSDGSFRWLQVWGNTEFVCTGADRKAVRIIGVYRDVTREKNVEDELRNAKILAERASMMKSEFLAHMSHEIRTPISGIIGMVDVLSPRIRDPEQQEYLSLVRESADSLLTIIGDVLDLSRIEAGVVEVEYSDWEIRKEISSVIAPFIMIARKKGLTFTLDIDHDVPAYIHSDREKTAQILRNLVSNAIKYTDKGTVGVFITGEKRRDSLYRLSISVRDTGMGIDHSKQKLIFESFVRLRKSVTERNVEGTGLGLTITKRLIELMEGSISVDSTVGKGSTFTVLLDIETIDAPVQKNSSSISSELSVIPPLSILVVEDNRINRMFIEILLREAGHQVSIACHGAEAVEMVRTAVEHPYDLILMDVQMPVMDGIEATRSIRALQGAVSGIPIIALTAFAMKGDEQRFRESGMNGYVTKPVIREELIRIIKHVWSG